MLQFEGLSVLSSSVPCGCYRGGTMLHVSLSLLHLLVLVVSVHWSTSATTRNTECKENVKVLLILSDSLPRE